MDGFGSSSPGLSIVFLFSRPPLRRNFCASRRSRLSQKLRVAFVFLDLFSFRFSFARTPKTPAFAPSLPPQICEGGGRGAVFRGAKAPSEKPSKRKKGGDGNGRNQERGKAEAGFLNERGRSGGGSSNAFGRAADELKRPNHQ